MIIGYQGIEGSFSNQAAKELMHKLGIKDGKLLPLVDSKSVVEKLLNNEIDYGVMAIKNSTAGIVEETRVALENQNIACIYLYDLRIVHCLFKLKSTPLERLQTVASHEQAIHQTKLTRQKYFKELREMEYADTALAAKDLTNGILGDNVAVICSKIAGELFGLELIYEGLNDRDDNTTTFGIFRKTN